MKLLIKFSFLIFGILILESCSVTENTEKYCPEDGCLLVRENPNDRYNEEVAKSDISYTGKFLKPLLNNKYKKTA